MYVSHVCKWHVYNIPSEISIHERRYMYVHMPLNVHQDIERYASACRYIKADTSKMWTECTWSTFTVISLYIAQHIQCMPRIVHTHAPLNLHQDIQRYVSTKEDVWCIEMPLNADQDIQRYGSTCTMHMCDMTHSYVRVQCMYRHSASSTCTSREYMYKSCTSRNIHKRMCKTKRASGRCIKYVKMPWHVCTLYTYEWVMSHIWMSHVTHMNESCHTHMNESCHTCEWVMSHIWMSHALTSSIRTHTRTHTHVHTHTHDRLWRRICQSCVWRRCKGDWTRRVWVMPALRIRMNWLWRIRRPSPTRSNLPMMMMPLGMSWVLSIAIISYPMIWYAIISTCWVLQWYHIQPYLHVRILWRMRKAVANALKPADDDDTLAYISLVFSIGIDAKWEYCNESRMRSPTRSSLLVLKIVCVFSVHVGLVFRNENIVMHEEGVRRRAQACVWWRLCVFLVFSIGLVFRNENVVMYEEGSRRHAQRRHGDDTVGLVFSV